MFESPWMYVLIILCLLVGLARKYMEYKKEQDRDQADRARHSREWASKVENKPQTTIEHENPRPMLSKKCSSCGATLDVNDQFCKYCGSPQRTVSEGNYTYSEQVIRRIDEAKIKEIELKKEELKHAGKWWQTLLAKTLLPVIAFILPFLLIMLIIKLTW